MKNAVSGHIFSDHRRNNWLKYFLIDRVITKAYLERKSIRTAMYCWFEIKTVPNVRRSTLERGNGVDLIDTISDDIPLALFHLKSYG